MDKLSLYDYLGFILPGGVVIASVLYGFEVLTFEREPTAVGTVLLVAAAFIVGHVVAGVAVYVCPLIWLKRPGSTVASAEGLFTSRRGSPYTDTDRASVEELFGRKFPDVVSFQQQFNVAYTRLRQLDMDSALQTINRQIGFYRNVTVALSGAVLVIASANIVGRRQLDWRVWIPILIICVVVLALRLRRFWVRFADEVVRGIRGLDLDRG